MNYDEIDSHIKEFTLQNEVNTYINTGKLPDYYYPSTNTFHNLNKINCLYKPIENNHIEKRFHQDIIENNIQTYIIQLQNNIQKCKCLEFEINNYQYDENNENNAEMCPICLEQIQTNNSISPPCKHRLCINCFVMNIKMGQNGDQCPLCRDNLF